VRYVNGDGEEQQKESRRFNKVVVAPNIYDNSLILFEDLLIYLLNYALSGVEWREY